MTAALLAFAAVAALVTITPGLDTALTVRMTLRDGRAAGMAAVLGICSGLLVWGVATALGITLLLRASQVAYDVLRIAGAVWLIVLGVRTLVTAAQHSVVAAADAAGPDRVAGLRGHIPAFRAGLVSNLLNPKVGVFYLTLLPQFVPDGAGVLLTIMLLAAIHALEGAVWLGLLALLVARARDLLGGGGVRRALDGLTGVVLLGLGMRIALDRR